MSIDKITDSLYEFMQEGFPSQQEAIRAIWNKDVDQIPVIRDLQPDRREAIVACYAKQIFLTMEKYPEQLAKGYLWLNSCEPDAPHLSTDYAKKGGDFFVGTDLLNWGYGYNAIEIQRKRINYRDEADQNSRKPLFVSIERLKTDHMPEELEHYKLFRNVVDVATCNRAV